MVGIIGGAEELRRGVADPRALAAVALDDDGWDRYWGALAALRPFGRAALELARELIHPGGAAIDVGCDLLGVLCNPDEGGFGLEVTLELVAVAGREDDAEVLWSVANALGHAADPAGTEMLARLRTHQDRDVRLAVAQALPMCHDPDDHDEMSLSAVALLDLMEDEHADVRDWATFAIARQIEVDGIGIREALAGRLADDDLETRREAAAGLARRRDRRALEVVKGMIQSGSPPWFVIEAAAYLGHEELLGPLRELAETWTDTGLSTLVRAIRRCDPAARSADLSRWNEVLTRLDQAGFSPALLCPLYETWVELDLAAQDGPMLSYGVEHLVDDRCQGDMTKLASVVAADAARISETS